MKAPSPSKCPVQWPSLPVFATLVIALFPGGRVAAQGAPARDAGSLRIVSPPAQSELESAAVTNRQSSADRSNKPCVLLKNDNVLFGRAHQLGEYVIVQTGPSDELRLARSEVACWARSIGDLYRYRLDQRSKPNLQAHLRDARWCMQHDLLDEAAKEIRAAKVISPNHHAVRLVEGQLERRRRPSAQPAPIKTANFTQDLPPADAGTANRVDPMLLKIFARDVQPALINRCGRCHNQDSNLPWRLKVPLVGTRPTAPTTRENLAAALQFVDRSDPQQSILLIKGTSPHGGGDAPLGVRNAKAIDALRRWLSLASGSLPSSGLGRIENQSQTPPIAPESALAQVSFESDVTAPPPSTIKTANKSNQPQRLPTVANPFDPSLFNRRFHRQDK